MTDYFRDTRHPWSCFLFVAPLLLAYEAGLLLSGAGDQNQLRNGADCWMRSNLAQLGISAIYGAPLVVLGLLFVWNLSQRQEKPVDSVSVWVGMNMESALFALGLFGLSKGMVPILHVLGVPMAMRSTLDPGAAQMLTYLGAGIYEETLFRLIGFSGLLWVFVQSEFPEAWSIHLATLGSALLFAGAHHWGPCGEVFHGNVFLFRTLAGVYFAWLYYLRGFGIAVGTHTGYDLLVGIFVPNWQSAG